MDEGTDTIVDFDGSEDQLLFTDVIDGPGEVIADIDNMSSISNVGGNVAVNFNNGTTVVFQGIPFADQSSISELVDDPSQIMAAYV